MFDIKLTTLFFVCCIFSNYVSSTTKRTKRSDGLLSDIVNLLVKEKFARENMMNEIRKIYLKTKKMFEKYKIQDRHRTIGYTGGLPTNHPLVPSDAILIFSRVISKFGKGYDIKSGVYTCEHPGTYLVDVSLTTITCDWAHAYLVKNHHNIARLYTGYHFRYNYPSGAMAFLVKLKKGDQIWIKSGRKCRWYTDSYLTILRV